MLQRDGAICFLAAWIDACALWRLYMPHLNTRGSSFFCFNQRTDWNVVAGNDVVVVQRCCTKGQFEFLKTCQALEMKIIYDLDDDVFDIPETNPAAKILGQYYHGFIECLKMVDLVTVSTKPLVQAIRRHAKQLYNLRTKKEIPIVVCENRVDERMFVDSVPVPRPLTVGWAGSSSHVGDLQLITGAIDEVAKEYPGVDFEFRGCDPPESLTQLPNFHYRVWMPVAEFAARMPLWGWDIALAPLTDHPFNEAKSCIKMLEAAYCGVPCLASWVRPYEQFCSRHPDLRWLLCAGKSNWAPKLRELINDSARRDYLGRLMRLVMERDFSYRQPHEGWREAFEMVKAL